MFNVKVNKIKLSHKENLIIISKSKSHKFQTELKWLILTMSNALLYLVNKIKNYIKHSQDVPL